MIRLIAFAFDFDGVIINEYQKHYQLSRKQIINLTEDEFKKLFYGNIHLEREKLRDRDTGFDVKESFNEHKKQVQVQARIKKILKDISEEYTLGIISSAKESGILECLQNNDLNGIFSFVFGFETHSQKEEKFKLVLDQFKIKPNQIIFITDTLGDILEAKSQGIQSIAVDFGYHSKIDLEKGNPLKIIHSFSDIFRTLHSLK